MKKNIIPILLLFTLFLSGCFALAEPEESSGAVAAPTLAPAEEPQEAPVETEEAALEPAPEEQEAVVEDAPTQEAQETEPYPPPLPTAANPDPAEAYPATKEGSTGDGVSAPEQTDPPAEYPAAGEGQDTMAGGSAVFEIDPARSEARFTINEVLRGSPKTVVGVSKNLGGQISLDLNDPASAQVGTILINARDFLTDNDFRNNAIANKILLTNDFEFITFEPTSIDGLPETVAIGETYPVQITGDLTITDQTREVTFDVEVTPLSETELQGLAALEILYADFGLTIPFAQSVDSVEDNVLLELDFIAAQ